MLKLSVRIAIPVLLFALLARCSEDSETFLMRLEYYPNEDFSIIIRTETNQSGDMPMSFLDEMEIKFELDTINPDGSYTLFADLVRINYDRGASMFAPP